jgi:hypothetical protein
MRRPGYTEWVFETLLRINKKISYGAGKCAFIERLR